MSIKDGWGKQSSPFHEGELSAQERVGVRERVAAVGFRAIRPFMPDQHREFFSKLPSLTIGSVDREGWPWASIIAGKPGFAKTPDDRTMRVDTSIISGDPLIGSLKPGAPLGLVGLDFFTRRRNRMNGTLSAVDKDGFELKVDLSFGNCPKYIQTREVEFIRDPLIAGNNAHVTAFNELDGAAVEMIRAADTFFVASYAKAESDSGLDGADVSHRGGKPGFVKVDGNTLTIPDYAGNLLYNTFGNFLVTPKAGLTFIDFETGDLLMLTGRVEIIWEKNLQVQAFHGAERTWTFTLDHGLYLKEAVPFRWQFGKYSPSTLSTGDWLEAD